MIWDHVPETCIIKKLNFHMYLDVLFCPISGLLWLHWPVCLCRHWHDPWSQTLTCLNASQGDLLTAFFTYSKVLLGVLAYFSFHINFKTSLSSSRKDTFLKKNWNCVKFIYLLGNSWHLYWHWIVLCRSTGCFPTHPSVLVWFSWRLAWRVWFIKMYVSC